MASVKMINGSIACVGVFLYLIEREFHRLESSYCL